MQDANNERGTRRTNDVRLFVHSSHSDDRMSPSVPNSPYKIAAGLYRVTGKAEARL